MTEDLLAEFRGNIYIGPRCWSPLVKLFMVTKVYNSSSARIIALHSKQTFVVGINSIRRCKRPTCLKELVEFMLLGAQT